MSTSIHTFSEYARVKEPLCLSFFETCLRLQEKKGAHTRVSYKDIMPAMHIGRDRLQRVLDCIARNRVYFKIKKGFVLEVSNIVMSVDWSRRFDYMGRPAYHFMVKKTETKTSKSTLKNAAL